MEAGLRLQSRPTTSEHMKISVIFGTRPEAIKLAPVILALRSDPRFQCRVCITAQHREMLDQVLDVFQIVPHTRLQLDAVQTRRFPRLRRAP